MDEHLRRELTLIEIQALERALKGYRRGRFCRLFGSALQALMVGFAASRAIDVDDWISLTAIVLIGCANIMLIYGFATELRQPK